MWDTTISLQPKIFCYSLIFGIFISVFFDLFRSLRRINNYSDLQVFFQDIGFFIIVTPAVFIFLLAYTYGILRAFVFSGLILGFIAWRITVSRYFVLLLSWILGLFKRFISEFSRKVSSISDKVILFLHENVKKFLKIVKKAAIFRKKLLKK